MYSFDVFDTIIIKRDENSFSFFQYVQMNLQGAEFDDVPQAVRRNFAEIRKNAAKMAERLCKKNGRECVRLRDIYQIIADTNVIAPQDVDGLETFECEKFVETSIGIDKNIELADTLIKQGEKICFFADTIYSEAVIGQILRKCSSSFEGISCFCSSELGKLQKTGSLFWKVNQITGIKRADWIYYSALDENRRQAQRVGFTLGEQEVAEIPEMAFPMNGNGYTHLMMRDISRLSLSECQSAKQGVGCRIGAPILLNYVEWLLDCADKLGISRLYFVARDGYILKKIADLLIKERNISIKTQYIHGSRKAWRLPSLCESNCDILELLKWSHVERVKTYGALSEIFGLSVEELSKFLVVYNVREDTAISRAALAYCIKKLKDNKEFKRYLIHKNVYSREMMKRYLRQELGTMSERFAFVELAGGGYTQKCLANVLQELGMPQITNMYFKIDSVQQYSSCRNYVFWPNDMRDSAIIETLCHSSEGQTSGYWECGGRVIPVMDEGEGNALKKYGYDEYVDGIMLFMRKYIRHAKDFLRNNWDLGMVNSYMEIIAGHSDQELLSFIADMPFGVTGREKKVLKYAPVLTESQLKEYYIQGKEEADDYLGVNWNYSLIRTQWKYPQIMEKYMNCTNARTDTAQEEGYPVEFIKDGAVMLCIDRFGEDIYRAVTKMGKEIIRLSGMAEMTEYLNTGHQVVLAIQDVIDLEKYETELAMLGIAQERILAVNLNPKYVLGK